MAGSGKFERAVGVMMRHVKNVNAVDAHYMVRKKNQSFGPIEIVPARQRLDATDLDGIATVGHMIDWIAERKDLVLLGENIIPSEGDEIIVVFDRWQTKVTYRVSAETAEAAYAWMDSMEVALRIHTTVIDRRPSN